MFRAILVVFFTLLPLSFAQSVQGSITLYSLPNFSGESRTIDFDVDTGKCVDESVPYEMNKRTRSVKVSAEGAKFRCILAENAYCHLDARHTGYFDVNIADLDVDQFEMANKTSSVWCEPTVVKQHKKEEEKKMGWFSHWDRRVKRDATQNVNWRGLSGDFFA